MWGDPFDVWLINQLLTLFTTFPYHDPCYSRWRRSPLMHPVPFEWSLYSILYFLFISFTVISFFFKIFVKVCLLYIFLRFYSLFLKLSRHCTSLNRNFIIRTLVIPFVSSRVTCDILIVVTYKVLSLLPPNYNSLSVISLLTSQIVVYYIPLFFLNILIKSPKSYYH